MSINKRKKKDPDKIIVQVRQEPRLKTDITVSADERIAAPKVESKPVSSDIPVATDTVKIQRNIPSISVKSDIPVSERGQHGRRT